MKYIKKHIIDNIEESYCFQLKEDEEGYLNDKYKQQLKTCYEEACNLEKQYQSSIDFIKIKIILVKAIDTGVVGVFPTIAKKLSSEEFETYENNNDVESSQEWVDEYIKNTNPSDRLLGLLYTSSFHVLPNKKIIEIVYSQERKEKLNGNYIDIFDQKIKLREQAVLNMNLENNLITKMTTNTKKI